MRQTFILIILPIILFASCKSKSNACRPCYSEKTEETGAIIPGLAFSPYLQIDSSRLNLNDVIPTHPLNLSELMPFAGNTVFPLYKNVVETAFRYEGVRYRRGGVSKRGMDCSGLVHTCFSAFGISLPRSSADMAKSVYDIPRQEAKKGDLIFFKTNGRRSINHVGLVIEANNDEIRFIHASIKSGVIVSSTNEAYYSRTFVKVGRVLHS